MPISHSYLEASSPPLKKHNPQHIWQHDIDRGHTGPMPDVVLDTAHVPMTDNTLASGLQPGETRTELIERIKREQRPTWLQSFTDAGADSCGSNPSSTPQCNDGEELANPITIERPRSALHAGDFNAAAEGAGELIPGSPRPYSDRPGDSWPGKCPEIPWPSPSRQATQPEHLLHDSSKPIPVQYRSRAASYSSISAGFVYKPPTSPLAQQSNSNDLDLLEDYAANRRTGSPDKSSRRRTYSPHSLRHPSVASLSTSTRPRVTMHRENTFPYQAHQPRRSLTFLNGLPLPVPPQSEAARRRSSVYSDCSPIQRAPLVGRYEESILRGRMSTLPSKPLEFVAKIGVLGKDKSKGRLKCPPHVTIPFPAVFYDYGPRRGEFSASEEGPSPYVGLVDLSQLQSQSRSASPLPKSEIEPPLNTSKRSSRQRNHQDKNPPPGTYRIPQLGQLQIVIKNPNNTAVKLFLVPYDLTGMAAGQKTFLRQRSYSAGPIVDVPSGPQSSNTLEEVGTGSDQRNNRSVLRYLIHIHICCPSEGRFYLYKNIRVVFANRVPDGKEKLRNEIQLPEPRYTAYKPDTQELEPTPQVASLIKRHSDASDSPFDRGVSAGGLEFALADSYSPPPSIPWRLPPPRTLLPPLDIKSDVTRPASSQRDRMVLDGASPKSHGMQDMEPVVSHVYDKLSHEDYGSPMRTQSPQPGEGLIALQFRDWVAEQRRSESPASRYDSATVEDE